MSSDGRGDAVLVAEAPRDEFHDDREEPNEQPAREVCSTEGVVRPLHVR